MPKYKSKPKEIEAEQWSEPEEWPKFYPARDLRPEFRKSVTLVDKGYASVRTIHNGQTVRLEPGDMILPEPDGIHYYPVKPDVFKDRWELVIE